MANRSALGSSPGRMAPESGSTARRRTRVVVRTDQLEPQVVEASPQLPAELVARIAALDRHVTDGNVAVDRALWVEPGRWAIGQRRGDESLWCIVDDEEVIARLGGIPAWLWTADSWFQPEIEEDPAPPSVLSLRQLLPRASGVGETWEAAVGAIGRAVAALVRSPPFGAATAVLVAPELLEADPAAARWLALVIGTVLPLGRRAALRVSVGEVAPDPADFDLVITSARLGRGFEVVESRADSLPDDPIAYYVANRLLADDPEALEAAARQFDSAGDPTAATQQWADGVIAIVRDGLPGISDLPPSAVHDDPPGALVTLTARLRASSPLAGDLLPTLVDLTVRTWDVRPWRALAGYTAPDRSAALRALAARPPPAIPPAWWIGELGQLVGETTSEEWFDALLVWLDRSEQPDALIAALTAAAPLVPDAAERLVGAGYGDLAQLIRPGRAAVEAAPAPAAQPHEEAPEEISPPALPEGRDELRELLEAVTATPGSGPERGLVLLRDAVAHSDFPDPWLAVIAEGVASRPHAPPVWGLLAVTAADPDTWDDETIDATVVAFCNGARDPESDAIARDCLLRLGRANAWEPLDLARWIVRLALAPNAEHHRILATSLLRGVRERPDATPFMAGIMGHMFDLTPEHAGSRVLMEGLAPAGWAGDPIGAVIEHLGLQNIPLSFRRTLVAIAEVQV